MRRSLLVVPLALLLLLVPSGSAVAATVRLDDRTGDVVYRAAPGERNDLRIRATDEPVRRAGEETTGSGGTTAGTGSPAGQGGT
jgi:hypothetical protein